MGTMKSGKTNSRHNSRAYSLRLNGTALGMVEPLIYGQTRTTPKLIWANDFNSTPVSTGKKSGKTGGTVFKYTIAADFLIGHRPLRGVLTAWQDKTIWVLNYCDETFVCPSNGQHTLGATPNPIIVGFPSGNPGEQHTIPSMSPFTITVNNAATFLSNTQVIYTVTQVKLTQVNSSPTQGQYTVSPGGVYTFSSSDAGLSVQISYTYNGGGSGPPVVYILGASAELPINVTFNDFGAPGPRTIAGTSAIPLWDARYALPLNDSDTDPNLGSTDPSQRNPYTFNVNSNTGLIVIGGGSPGPLVGRNITIFYAFQFPDPTTGFGTPLANLALLWEPILASSSPGGANPITMASEYANHPDQWCPFTYLTGAGGPFFSLGETDTLPNLSFETVGLYQLGHVRPDPLGGHRFVGGANPADVLMDMVSSGPLVILPGTPA